MIIIINLITTDEYTFNLSVHNGIKSDILPVGILIAAAY